MSKKKNPIEEMKTLDLESKDVTDEHLDKIAKGFILGKTKVKNSNQIKDKLEERVTKKIGSKGKYLTDKLFELIEGVYVVQKQEDGKQIKYYKVPPNLQAIQYALDRVLGKPTQKTERGDEDKEGIKTVEALIKNLAGYRVVHEENEKPKKYREADIIDEGSGEDSVQG